MVVHSKRARDSTASVAMPICASRFTVSSGLPVISAPLLLVSVVLMKVSTAAQCGGYTHVGLGPWPSWPGMRYLRP